MVNIEFHHALNVSGGTAIIKDKEGYREISRNRIQGREQGLALAFLSWIIKTFEIEG